MGAVKHDNLINDQACERDNLVSFYLWGHEVIV